MASSASRTWRAEASASEYTAIVRMPILRAVRKMRQAISPRLAMRRLRIILVSAIVVPSHPEETEACVLLRRIAHGRETEAEDPARLERIDHAIVPEPRRGVIRMALALVLVADRLLERLLLLCRPTAARRLELSALDGGEHAGGLLPAHDGDAGVGPLEEEPRRERAPAHGVVACAVAASDDDGELRNPRASHRGDELCAILGDAAGLRAPAHHEAGDVLQKKERDALARAQLD